MDVRTRLLVWYTLCRRSVLVEKIRIPLYLLPPRFRPLSTIVPLASTGGQRDGVKEQFVEVRMRRGARSIRTVMELEIFECPCGNGWERTSCEASAYLRRSRMQLGLQKLMMYWCLKKEILDPSCIIYASRRYRNIIPTCLHRIFRYDDCVLSKNKLR